jgi:uncharacterized membrane protein
MNHVKAAAAGVAAGSLLMYFLDPDRGKRRRALVRDKAARTSHDFSTLIDKAQRDISNRAAGAWHGAKTFFTDGSADPDVLVQRVRSRLGRAASHPHAVEVTAEGDAIVLHGTVSGSEMDRLVRYARSVKGVKNVLNRLKATPVAEAGSHREWARRRWTPSLRLGAGVAGGALLLYGTRRGGAGGLAANLAGSALLARAISNHDLLDIVGAGDGARVIEFEKAVHIQAPVEEVFAFWSDYSKFSRFMSHLKEVRDLGGGKSHWVAEGPAGIPVSWDAELIRNVPKELLSWRSVPGSVLETEGTVRFEENSHGGTRVSLRMCYKPPAGVLGHYVASLFGSDPKREIDEDLVRLKSLIELGRTRAHGERITREALADDVLH